MIELILNILLITNKICMIVFNLLWSLGYFALGNSLLWAFIIPKIIHDEMVFNFNLTKQIYQIYARNITIASLFINVYL